jgi:hypothetical protein
MTAGPGTVPSGDDPCLLLYAPRGIAVGNGSKVATKLALFNDPGGTPRPIGGVNYTVDGGVNDTDWRTQLVMSGLVLGDEVARFNALSTTAASSPPPRQVVTDWTDGQSQARLRLFKNTGGAANVADDDHWSAITNLRVTALLFGQDGNEITAQGFYTPDYLLAHQIVVDLLWYFSGQGTFAGHLVDVAGASIDTGFARHIKQFAYPDFVRPVDLLDDLCGIELDMTYGVFESNPAGLHRFELGRYEDDADPRYVADSADGLSLTGGEGGLANAVRYKWTDAVDGPSSSFATLLGADDLAQWGRWRYADPIDFGNEAGVDTRNEADDLAVGYLEQLAATDALSGTLTLRRPIMDRHRGCTVWPWEIEPGHKIVVRDVSPTPVKISETTWSSSTRSADLTLGVPVLTTDELLNRVARRRKRSGSNRPSSIQT